MREKKDLKKETHNEVMCSMVFPRNVEQSEKDG